MILHLQKVYFPFMFGISFFFNEFLLSMKNHAFAELCILLVHSYYHSIMDLLFLAVKIEIYPKTGTLVHYNAILCFPATVCFENEQETVLINCSHCHT